MHLQIERETKAFLLIILAIRKFGIGFFTSTAYSIVALKQFSDNIYTFHYYFEAM